MYSFYFSNCSETSPKQKKPTKESDSRPEAITEEVILLDSTETIEDIEIREQNILNFINAEPIRSNRRALKFHPTIAINWQDFLPDSLKPMSSINSDGIDYEHMQYADFPWNTFSSRSANNQMSDDSLYYFAINKDELCLLSIDSLEAEVTYQRDMYGTANGVYYSGNFIGYCTSQLDVISFIIQTPQKDIIDKTSFQTVEQENIIISKEDKHSDKFQIILQLDGKEYIGIADESSLILSETQIIQFENSMTFLLTSWTDDGMGQQCENYYRLYELVNGELKPIAGNNYNCDI